MVFAMRSLMGILRKTKNGPRGPFHQVGGASGLDPVAPLLQAIYACAAAIARATARAPRKPPARA